MSKVAAASTIDDNENYFAGLEEDEEDVIKILATDWNFFRTNYSDQVDTNLTIGEHIFFDLELWSNRSILTDKDIIHEVLGNCTDASSDENDMEVSEEESIRKPLKEKVRRGIEMLEEFSL